MAGDLNTAVLLAAGRGARLGELTRRMPKPLLEVAGTPIIEHVVDALADSGIQRFVIVVGHLGEQVEAWCARFEAKNSQISIQPVQQRELNGTAGGLLAAKALLEGESRFIFGWGDVLMTRENYRRFVARAAIHDFDLLLAVNQMADPFAGAAVYVTDDLRVTRLVEKPARGTSTTNWNNAGLFATRRELLDYAARLAPSQREELELPQAIAAMINDGKQVRAFKVEGFWSDVGTPEDLEFARKHYPAPERLR